jgi:hypothetical protein
MGASGRNAQGVFIFDSHDYRTALSLLLVYLVVACFSVFFMKDPKKQAC